MKSSTRVAEQETRRDLAPGVCYKGGEIMEAMYLHHHLGADIPNIILYNRHLICHYPIKQKAVLTCYHK